MAAFCHKCGAQLPMGATFCPTCGTSVFSSASPQAAVQTPMGPQRGEKAEKREKQEKHEKNEKGEKGEGGSLLGAFVGGSIVIWLGITFFLEQNGYLPSDIWWAYFVSGLGAVLVIQGVVIHSRGHVGLGPIIGGAVALFIGLSSIAARQFSFTDRLWPLLIVALGVFILFTGIAARRRVPKP